MSAHIDQFCSAIHGAGLSPPDVIEADGKLHRFASNGKRGDDAGWYVFHDDAISAGAFGDWRNGLSETWRADIGRSLSPEELAAYRARVDAIRCEREAEDAKRKGEASERANGIWLSASPAPANHPYLLRKGVEAHGARVFTGTLGVAGMDCEGALVIPLRDVSGHLHSLQFIARDGKKRYLTGGRVRGCYFVIGKLDGVLVIAEGFATAASIHQATGYATACAFNAGNLEFVATTLRDKFPVVPIIVAADNDVGGGGPNVGVSKAREAARAVGALVVVPELDGGKCDFNDMMLAKGLEPVRAAIEGAQEPSAAEPAASTDWTTPVPLPAGLAPVAVFDYELLPPLLHRRVADISERMQCPPDFPAVAVMIMLASLLGRRCGIAPKREDDWLVVPNLWGAVIGRPGIMKSPPLAEVMRPLQVLQTQAMECYEQAQTDHQAGAMVAAVAERVAKDAIRKLLKTGKRAAAEECAQEALARDNTEPVCRRYIVNDTTVEKLGVILNENSQGVLLFRDELNGFFRTLERQGHEADRAFYLECWNGDSGFTYDRIGRGTLHIAGACLSILGSIQPGPLSELVRGLRGDGDDGLLQRFQLAVWPDVSEKWRNVDRAPDREARDAVQSIIERFDRITAERLGATPGDIPVLRFSEDAQALFDVWREALEHRLRADTEHPALEAHLAKYRSLVPSLALLIHLTDTEGGAVNRLPLERAIAWAEYLETHARRIYAPAIRPDVDAARALAHRITAGALTASFSLRDVYNKGWSGLSTRDEVKAAVEVLIDHDWLRGVEEQTFGRTRTVYRINPLVSPEVRT